jgi:hypothetical protein
MNGTSYSDPQIGISDDAENYFQKEERQCFLWKGHSRRPRRALPDESPNTPSRDVAQCCAIRSECRGLRGFHMLANRQEAAFESSGSIWRRRLLNLVHVKVDPQTPIKASRQLKRYHATITITEIAIGD